MMNIAVIGTGYVGLVTGTCMAETGNTVICMDADKEKVYSMRNGEIPIYEPHLDALFERNIKQGRLTFSTDLRTTVENAQIIFLALPTPPGANGEADLSIVLGVAREIGKYITTYKVIVDKSTVPVGTAEKVREVIAEQTDCEFDVVSNPEFLREGYAVEDFMKPDRVIIGSSTEKARKIMGDLFAPYVRQGNPIIHMDERSAELTKYAANAFLATKISFMNEIANYCELTGADVDMVRMGVGTDDRIGKRFLFPGVGYGGSCFPKDVQALEKSGKDAGYHFGILRSVMEANRQQRAFFVKKIIAYFGDHLKGKRMAVWGLAFKPDTDDIREAPSLYIIRELLDHGVSISVFDPEAMENVRKELSDQVTYATDHYAALKDADALLIVTEWSVFRSPDLGRMGELMKSKVIFDGRNVYQLSTMEENGFYYNSVGRRLIQP
jgi:UDPglucose 6-dehydrogenase